MFKISSDTVIATGVLAVIGVSVAIFGKAGLMVLLVPFMVMSYANAEPNRIQQKINNRHSSKDRK